MSTLFTIDSHLRITIFIIITSFYLNKNNILTINSNNINFFTISTPITLQNYIAIVNKILGRQILTNFSKRVCICHKRNYIVYFVKTGKDRKNP